MSEEILLEIKSNDLIGSVYEREVLHVKDDGLHLFKEGIKTYYKNDNIHIPFHHIVSVEIDKKVFGIQYDLRIRDSSGKSHFVSSVNKEEGENAKRFIIEMREWVENQNKKSNHNLTKTVDFTEQLLNLAKLRDSGILTQEEFEVQKSRILDQNS